MNDFLYQEILAEEYHRDKMATAEKHNRYAHLYEKKVTLFTYKTLSKLGETLENAGGKMRSRYESLVLRETRNLLSTPVK